MLLMAFSIRLSAHPTSLTTVSIIVGRAGSADVILTSPADALMAKLEVGDEGSDRVAAVSSDAGLSREALKRLAPSLLNLVELRTDLAVVPLSLVGVQVDEAGVATLRLSGPLPGAATHILWRSRIVYGSYPIAIKTSSGLDTLQWVQGPEQTQPVAVGTRTPLPLFGRGIRLGFTHIVPHGLDHILFVAGLTLLNTRRRQVLLFVTAFTLAHSLTLALSLYGVVSLPSRVVEPLIALSVAYVGLERLLTRRLERARLGVVFAFGLLHGLGFAEALAALHLATPDLAWMLVSFNIGVEAGQITVLGTVLLLLWALTRSTFTKSWPVGHVASGLVGLTGLVWTVERVL